MRAGGPPFPATSAVSVAIVEDDESILDAVRMLLETHGWRVRVYASGEPFIADLGEHTPDCLILDPHLPGMNGADVVRTLMELQIDLPVIGLTAWPDSPLALEIVSLGVSVMLTKPVRSEELIEQIGFAIRERG